MRDLRHLLNDARIRTAVIIDDAFDIVPRPHELDDRSWSVFFDDIGEEGTDLLVNLYPNYRAVSPEKLKLSQDFITLLWENRAKLPNSANDALFNEYIDTNASDRRNLDALVTSLEQLGLECTTSGEDVGEVANDADLIVVDLFLGFRQMDEDIERAIRLVSNLVKLRAQSPPLVVLMSRSSRLESKRDEFRDKAGLLGSMFRVVKKVDLADQRRLDTLLRRLADHYEDAKRVAGFVHAWDAGLEQARERFIQVLRRLDLSDIAQIQALLLEYEGQQLSEYLLDVADRVLQHEIERNRDTISAAMELNKLDVNKYPAPHLTGSPDLQELVHRMVFLHEERLRLSSSDSNKYRLQFGDVLLWTRKPKGEPDGDVSLVVTPACDLIRRSANRVMLLSGKLFGLEPTGWSYKDAPVRTPIMVLSNGERKWIKWNLRDVRTLSWAELENLLDRSAELHRIGRIREIYAVEIQQKMIASIGRIGSPANLPGAFPVQVALFFVGSDAKAHPIVVGGFGAALCYVGRDEESRPVHRLVLTEEACDEIERAVGTLGEEQVHQSARQSLSSVKRDRTLFHRLERGVVEVPDRTTGQRAVREGNQVLAVVIRRDDFDEGSEARGDSRRAAVIVRVTDV